MNNLILSVNAVIPFLIYIIFGYGVRRAGVADEAFLRRVNQMSFRCFFPLLAFNNLYAIKDFSQLRPLYLAELVISVFAVVAGSLLIVPRLVKSNTRRPVVIQAIYRSNILLFAMPLTQSLFGEQEVAVATIIITLIVPLYNVIAVILLESYRGGRANAVDLIKKVLSNPLIRGAIVGLIFVAFGWKLPSAVAKPVTQIANLTTPLALFILGGTLKFDSMRRNMPAILPTIFVKMMVLPAIALAISVPLGMNGLESFVFFCLYGTPVATSSYPMAESMGADGALAGELVAFSTVFSILSIFFWVFFMKSIGLF